MFTSVFTRGVLRSFIELTVNSFTLFSDIESFIESKNATEKTAETQRFHDVYDRHETQIGSKRAQIPKWIGRCPSCLHTIMECIIQTHVKMLYFYPIKLFFIEPYF